MSKNKDIGKVIMLTFLACCAVLGVVFWILLVTTFLDTKRFVEESHVATGEVVRMVNKNAVVRFFDAYGLETQFVTRSTGLFSPFYVGRIVKVQYILDGEPDARVADDFIDVWVAPMAFGFASIVTTFTAIIPSFLFLRGWARRLYKKHQVAMQKREKRE